MAVNREWLAPCGLYCGVCGILIAHRDGNQKFKERLSSVYNVPADMIRCEGCLSDNVFVYCQVCPIKNCAREKKIDGCHQCDLFPCHHIENFPMPVGKKVILRAIPIWRELGDEAFAAAEEQRYHCPECGQPLFRGAKRCRSCHHLVDVD